MIPEARYLTLGPVATVCLRLTFGYGLRILMAGASNHRVQVIFRFLAMLRALLLILKALFFKFNSYGTSSIFGLRGLQTVESSTGFKSSLLKFIKMRCDLRH